TTHCPQLRSSARAGAISRCATRLHRGFSGVVHAGYGRTMPEPLLHPDAVVTSFDHGGATLVVEDLGSGTRPFVLLHGIGMGRSVYVDFVERLQGRIIAVDLPGFGE